VFSLAAFLALAACGSSSKKSSGPAADTASTRPVVNVDAKEFAFTIPDQIPSGWVDVALHNSGKQEHQIAFIKLGSMTFAQLKARAATTDLSNLPPDTVFAGGPNSVGPGQTVTATVHLAPGAYAVACFIPDFAGDNKPHALHGMLKQVTVAATPQSVEQAPSADGGTIQLSEFTFVVPQGFKGQGTVKIDAVGTQVHEMIIYRIVPGKTFDDVKNYVIGGATGKPVAGPPPFEDAGGIVGLGPHQTNYQKMSLAPGKYALLCFFPDTSSKVGLPHALKGMAQELDIS
jgi:hypothetical protein